MENEHLDWLLREINPEETVRKRENVRLEKLVKKLRRKINHNIKHYQGLSEVLEEIEEELSKRGRL